ncbi:hypothetical protein B0H14DRAFT_3497622 [Mycena olivaceomarginata]|nr:hypothetical protein B0H14DRAFT_3497622 [Mycena olivaceomarginata]
MISPPLLPVFLTSTPRIRPASRSPAAPAAPARAFHLPSPPLPFAPANALPPATALVPSYSSMPAYPRTSNPSALLHPTRLYPIPPSLAVPPPSSPRPRNPVIALQHSFHPITILASCPDPPPHSDARKYSSSRHHARLRAASPTYSSHHSVRYSQSCHACTSTAARTNVDAVSNPCPRPARPTRRLEASKYWALWASTLMPFVRATLVINASTVRTYAFFVSPRRGHFAHPPHDAGAGKPAMRIRTSIALT